MLGMKLLVLAALAHGTAATTESALLVKQLGSSRYAEREAAATALQQQGRPALSALRDARRSRDPEIQSRVNRLIFKIEGDLLTQPTPVSLAFRNATLNDVAQSFSEQTGFRVALAPANRAQWKLERINLTSPEPLTFWQAVDRLCDMAHLEYSTGIHSDLGRREPVFSFSSRYLESATPVSDFGPFRVRLVGIHFQRDVNFGGPKLTFVDGLDADRPIVIDRRPTPGTARAGVSKPSPELSEQFNASLIVSAEPRLAVGLQAPARLLEAFDERAASLISPTAPVDHDSARFATFPQVMGSPDVTLRVPLLRPATTGSTIKILRGVIPLTVSARRDDPLAIPLEDAPGKMFENPDVQITVHNVRTRPELGQTLVELSIRPTDGSTSDDVPDLLSATDSQLRAGPHPYQVQFLDDQNQTVPWLSGFDSENGHVILTLTQLPRAPRLKQLRYFSLTRAVVQLPFEFKDIPLP